MSLQNYKSPLLMTKCFLFADNIHITQSFVSETGQKSNESIPGINILTDGNQSSCIPMFTGHGNHYMISINQSSCFGPHFILSITLINTDCKQVGVSSPTNHNQNGCNILNPCIMQHSTTMDDNDGIIHCKFLCNKVCDINIHWNRMKWIPQQKYWQICEMSFVY